MCLHLSPLYWISFPFRSPQSTEQSSLCCTLGSHQFFTAAAAVFYTQYQQCMYINPSFPIHPFTLLLSIHLFYMSVSLCFVNKIVYTNFFRFHIYVYYMVFAFLFLTYLTQYDSLFMSPQMTQFCSFLRQRSVPFYICTAYSLSISLLMDIQVVSMSRLL